jgi:NAD(P)-dependent dehydrogenase (short-subunit alcohol dehydrogenase family)
MDFTNRHVVITGASSGIGLATAKKIAALGGRVTLMARRPDVLEAAAREVGANACAIAVDVGHKKEFLAALEKAIAESGPIDGLFLNAASGGIFVPVWEYTDEALENLLLVNVQSPFWAVQHVLPAMMARKQGSILITGSLGSARAMNGNSGYIVSKHATLGLARAVAAEAAASGVRCNCIIPGFIETPMLAAAPDEAKATMARITPQQRLGEPEEVAEVATFLLSDGSRHVTAQSWAVDGGLLGSLMMT